MGWVATINSIGHSLYLMTGVPTVDVDDEINATGALLVTCVPSVGFVSSIVAHYLVE